MYETEKSILEETEIITGDKSLKGNPLFESYANLSKAYKIIFKQLKRLIRISDKEQLRIKNLNDALDIRNDFIKKTFGTFLSDEIVETILDSPDGLQMGGESRVVTIMMTDLRGFTSIGEKLSPATVVSMLNIYLEAMTEIIIKYNGTIDEFIGDAILVIFGAPMMRDDDPDRAVACALEMQLAMGGVNEKFEELGYPRISMGIGINTGEVVVGNIGSTRRIKYGVVGSNVNLTSRIESYTLGGEILISESTLNDCKAEIKVVSKREVLPKGVNMPLMIYEISGIVGDYEVYLEEKKDCYLKNLDKPFLSHFKILEGKHGQTTLHGASITMVSTEIAEIRSEVPVEKYVNIQFFLYDESGSELFDGIYCKVVEVISEHPSIFRVAFTSICDKAIEFFNSIEDYKIEGS